MIISIACIIYSDPIEDGEITADKGYKVYPFGPARQPSSVQRGSTQFLSTYPGDPLTPFKPAYKHADRMDRHDPGINIPSIPSLPISYEDALPLLRSLNGKGVKVATTGGLGYLGVDYFSGPGEDSIYVLNHIEEKITPIWRVPLDARLITHANVLTSLSTTGIR